MPEEKIEEETYSLIFKSLKHPIRRKILRILVDRQMAFSEILDILSIDSGHLSYHIENLGDLVKRSANGKYELSSIGIAAVDLMSGVEERPQLLTPPRRLKGKKIRNVLIGAVLIILIASVIASAALNIYYSNSLQTSLEKNRRGSGFMARWFHHSVGRATDIEYLLRIYRKGYAENEPNEDNIEALIDGFFYEMHYSYLFLYGLRDLNPELSEYEKPLYFIDMFIQYTIIQWKSFTGGPTVRSVLAHLLSQAESSHPYNYSILLTAFKELNQPSFQKIDELSFEFAESFAPLNATRLDNTVNMVEELQTIIGQWTDKYSQM